MARNHARFDVLRPSDTDWAALPPGAQWLYMVLLRQPKLSLAGHLDVKPQRWASSAAGVTAEQVDGWLAVLVATAYVLVDESTDELLVRTFAKHDLKPGHMSGPVIKGLWSAYESILSPDLRHEFVAGMPDDLWAKCAPLAPDEAGRFRTSPPLKREPAPPFESADVPPVECPSSFLLSPANPSSSSLRTTHDPALNDNDAAGGGPGEPVDHTQLVRRAANLVGRAVAEVQAHTNPAGMARTVTAAILDGSDPVAHGRIVGLLADGLTPEAIAEGWLPDALTGAGFGAQSPAPGPDALGVYAAAEAARREQMAHQEAAPPAVVREILEATRRREVAS